MPLLLLGSGGLAGSPAGHALVPATHFTTSLGDEGWISPSLKVGGLSAPLNTLEGDATVRRLIVGDEAAVAESASLYLRRTGVAPAGAQPYTALFVDIGLTPDGTSGSAGRHGLGFTFTIAPTAADDGAFRGVQAYLTHNAGAFNLDGSMSGFSSIVEQSVAGSTLNTMHAYGAAIQFSGGNITTARGYISTLTGAGGGTLSTLNYFDIAVNSLPAAITTHRGLNIPNLGGAGVGTAVGIDITAQTGGGTNFGIRNASNLIQTGYARFGGVTVPLNVTDGDVTATRALIGADFSVPINTALYINFATPGAAEQLKIRNPLAGGGATATLTFGQDPAGHAGFSNSFPNGNLGLRAGGGTAELNLYQNPSGTGPNAALSTLGWEVRSGPALIATYVQVGGLTAPTNTTTGDLTVARLFVTDAALDAEGRMAQILDSFTPGTPSVKNTLYVRLNATPGAGAAADELRASKFELNVRPTANYAGIGMGFYTEAEHDSGPFNVQRLIGFFGQALQNAAGTTVSQLWGGHLTYRAVAGTVTEALGLHIDKGSSLDAGAITTAIGLRISASTGPAPTIDVGIQVLGSGAHSRFQGAIIVGADVNPANGYALDVRGNARVEIGGVQKFDVQAGAVTVGTDGTSPRLVLSAMDAISEGGEIQLNGAAANIDWFYDNNAGILRWFESGVVRMRLRPATPTGLQVAGFLRVGSDSVPNNTTVGDITGLRLVIGDNTTLGGFNGVIGRFIGTATDTAAGAVLGISAALNIAPTSNSSSEFRSLTFSNALQSPTGVTLNLVRAGYFENRHRQDGAVGEIIGVRAVSVVVDSSSPATVGTVTTGIAFDAIIHGRPSGTTTVSITNAYGLNLGSERLASGVTITTLRDIFIANPPSGPTITTHVGLDIEALTRAPTNIGIRNRSVLRQVGDAIFGVDTAPAALVHVLQQTLGNEVQRLESVATSDDPRESVYQNRVATTDATQMTLHTVTIPASTTVQIIAFVQARRTGGAAGSAEDGAGYVVVATVKNVAGTASLIGAVSQLVTQEDQSAWDATIDVTGATARVRVTGAANNNVTWHATIRALQVGS